MQNPSHLGSSSAAMNVSSSSRRPTKGHRVATVIGRERRRHDASPTRLDLTAARGGISWSGEESDPRLDHDHRRLVGIVANIFDAVDDGSGVWNSAAIIWFAVVVVYGFRYLIELSLGR